MSGSPYTKFELGARYLTEYLARVGLRCVVVDISGGARSHVSIPDSRTLTLGELSEKMAMAEQIGYLRCRPNQLGYLVSMLDNLDGVSVLIVVCNEREYTYVYDLILPLCSTLNRDFVIHHCEDAVLDYLDSGLRSTTVFLSSAAVEENFDIMKYKDSFDGQRVALFETVQPDTTEFYECAIGGVTRA